MWCVVNVHAQKNFNDSFLQYHTLDLCQQVCRGEDSLPTGAVQASNFFGVKNSSKIYSAFSSPRRKPIDWLTSGYLTCVPGRGLSPYGSGTGFKFFRSKKLLKNIFSLFESSLTTCLKAVCARVNSLRSFVPGRGLEPPWIAPRAPKARASTNFATPAICPLCKEAKI